MMPEANDGAFSTALEIAKNRAAIVFRALAKASPMRSSVLLEAAALCVGSKPAIRIVCESGSAETLREVFRDSGFFFDTRTIFTTSRGGTWSQIDLSEGSNTASLAVISLSPQLTSQLLDAEITDASSAGLLLGYPKCCVQAFPRLSQAGAKWPFELLGGFSDISEINARCNRFAADWGGIGLIGELFPCSLECLSAILYADKLKEAALELGLYRLVETAEKHALTPIEILPDGTISRVISGSGLRVGFKL